MEEILKLAGMWFKALEDAEAAKTVIERERVLRAELVAMAFPKPKEGVNSLALPEGWTLKADYKLDRKVDEAALESVVENMAKKFGIDGHLLVRYKPELDKKNYKALTAEQQKVFDECLVIKPGSPQLELKAPKVA